MWIVLAYLWLLAFLPLILAHDDAEVRWHARHGILLMESEVALLAAFFTLSAIVHFARFGLGGAMLIALVSAWAAVLALHIAAILKGLDGRRLIVPGVTHFLR